MSCNKHRFLLFSFIAVSPRGRVVFKTVNQNKKLIKLQSSESQLFIKFDSSNWDTGFPGESGEHRRDLNVGNLEV